MDDAEICTICLEELEEDCYHDVATLSCSHKFHIMCILEWFQNKDINYCPLCVQQVSIQKIRRSRRGQEEHEHNKQIEENIIVIPAKNIKIISEKAQNGKLTIEDLQGGTFTITNGGIYGSMLSTPILNPPQSAVLGMHNIIERPVVIDGLVTVRPIMYLALSYDHRIIDGKEAVSFLKTVKECLEQPKRLFLNL